MTKIAPSILSADFADMGSAVKNLELWGADYIHCDVMDGQYVPNITFGQQMIRAIRKRTDLPLDVHLMVNTPDRIALSFVEAGASFVTFHCDDIAHPHRLLGQIRAEGCKTGVALNPSVAPESAVYLLELCDMVLLMSVNPGFGGQSFIHSTLQRARKLVELREKLGLKFDIEIDGGINEQTGAIAVQAGVDVLVAGNAVFNAPDPAAVVCALKSLK